MVAKKFTVENLQVELYENRDQMGAAAGKAVAAKVKDLLDKQQTVSMIFAAAPSQNEILKALVEEADIDWSRIVAFHMDEYVGLSEDSPELFRRYLEENLFDIVQPGQVHFINPHMDEEQECERYARLIVENPIDIVCCGIGENGHIAFNDPPVADFLDPKLVKVVELDHACRQQQVNDGCFPSLDDVPTHAITLTIPALLSGRYIYCVVPGPTKADAVYNTINGPVTTECPASVLRRHFRSILYIDQDAGARLD